MLNSRLIKVMVSLFITFSILSAMAFDVYGNAEKTDYASLSDGFSPFNTSLRLSSNGISAYSAAARSSVTGKAAETEIFEYLTGTMNLNQAAACGILANIQYESGFNPNALGDNGTSYGICQWHNGRWDRLKSYCSLNGLDWKTLHGQLCYLDYELKNYYSYVLNYVRNVSNDPDGAYNAAAYWVHKFEIPANANYHANARGNLAKNKYWYAYSGSMTCSCDESYAGNYTYSGGGYLNIRSGHGTQYSIVGTIPDGSTVYVSKSDDTWAHIEYSGISGYVYMPYLQRYIKQPVLTASKTSVNLANNDSTSVYLGLDSEATETYYMNIASTTGSGYTAQFIGEWDGSSTMLYITSTEKSGGGIIKISLIRASTNEIVSTISIDVSVVVDSFSVSYMFSVANNEIMLKGFPAVQHKIPGERLKLAYDMPDKMGYNFKGWSKSFTQSLKLDGNIDYLPGDYYTEDKSASFYAVWNDPYIMEGCKCENNISITTPNSCKYIKFTPTFSGQYIIRSEGSCDTYGKLYDENGNLLTSNDDLGLDRNFLMTYELYAGRTYYIRTNLYDSTKTGLFNVVTDRALHSLFYYGNGGSSIPEVQVKTYGTDLVLSQSEPIRNGYKFMGWATTSTATEAEYLPGDLFKKDEDTNLYAVWEEIAIESPQIDISKTSNGVIIVWGDISEAESYDVYQVKGDEIVKVGTTSDTKFTISNLLKGNYSFYVTASNPVATSDISNVEVVDINNLIGDLNGDGVANNKDIILMRNILSLENKDNYMNIADLNNDGKINNRDLVILRTIVSNVHN